MLEAASGQMQLTTVSNKRDSNEDEQIWLWSVVEIYRIQTFNFMQEAC